MNKLAKEKRDHLILASLGTVLVVGLIIYGLIRPQYAAISHIKKLTADARAELQQKKDSIKTSGSVSGDLAELTDKLRSSESDLAAGDPSVWIYDTIRNFKAKYKVTVSVNSQLDIGQVDLLGHFPYKQLKVTATGSAYYHDLGKFIADFENSYPHARVVNLTIDPAGGTGDEAEKLSFRMEIIALINPDGSPAALPPTLPASPQLLQSVFTIPANPSEGRDPFFPNSVRVYGNKTEKPSQGPALSELTVRSILVTPQSVLAIINNHPFAIGEDGDVIIAKTGQRQHIRCADINPKAGTVTVEADGFSRVLHLTSEP